MQLPWSSLQIEKECYIITLIAVCLHTIAFFFFSFCWSNSSFFHFQLRNVNLSCVRTCMVVAEERPRIALTQSFSKIFKDLGLSPRAVSTTFGCRVNVAICLQVSSWWRTKRRVGEVQSPWWSMFLGAKLAMNLCNNSDKHSAVHWKGHNVSQKYNLVYH